MFTESPISSVAKKKKRKSQNFAFNEQDLTENVTPKKSKQTEKLLKDESKPIKEKIPIVKTPKTKKSEENAQKSAEKKKSIEKSVEKKKKNVDKSLEKKKNNKKSSEKKIEFENVKESNGQNCFNHENLKYYFLFIYAKPG